MPLLGVVKRVTMVTGGFACFFEEALVTAVVAVAAPRTKARHAINRRFVSTENCFATLGFWRCFAGFGANMVKVSANSQHS